jgi:peptidoglycan LD-endopeptidase LytH
MTHTLLARGMTALVIALIAITSLLPLFLSPKQVRAASDAPPIGIYSNHEDDEDEEDEDEDEDDDDDDDDDDRFSQFRYSSSLSRKIRALDDDEVDEMPIPVALGVAVRNLWPNFGDPRDGGARKHEGLDIMAPKGAFVASPTEAVVVRTGKGSSSGIYVTTIGPGGETFNYYHLDDIADGVRSGTELEVGDLIGYVGNTGNASGGAPHLHFEIRENRRAEDPFPRLTMEFSDEVRIRLLTDLLKELQAELKRLLD